MGKLLKRYRFQIGIFFGIIIIKTIINMCFGTLVLMTGQDEIGTMAGSVYYAGYDWSAIVSEVKYYGFGFSILMAPVFSITDNPQIIYQVMLAYNTICLAVSGVICFNIIKNIFDVDDDRFNLLTTLAAVSFPCVLLTSNEVFNECVLHLMQWAIVYLLLIMQKRKDEEKSNLVCTIILSIISVYAFTVHTRIIYILGAVFIYIVMYLIIKRKVLINVPAFVIIMGGGYAAAQKLIKAVQLKIWLTNDPEKLRNSVSNLGGYFGNVTYLKTANGIKGFVYTFVGEVYGMFSLSGGIFAIATCMFVFIILSLIFNKKFKKVDEKLVTLAAYICSLMLAILLLTSLGVLDIVEENVIDGTASRWYLYTRYWSMCSQLAVMFVLLFAKKQERPGKGIIISSILVFASVTAAFMYKMSGMFNIYQGAKSNAFSSYLGMLIMKTDDYFSVSSFVKMTVMASVVFIAVLILLYAKKPAISALIVLCLFLYTYGYSTFMLDMPNSQDMYDEFKEMRTVIKESNIEENDLINLNLREKSRAYLFGTQFNLYEYRVTREKADKEAVRSVVISDSADYADMGYTKLYSNEDSNYYDCIYVWTKGY